MANSDKNIVITPNRNLSDLPNISITGFGNSTMTLTIPDSTTGTLEFRSGINTVFSVDSNVSSGNLFSVTDPSLLPILEINDNGLTGRTNFYRPVKIVNSKGLVVPRSDHLETFPTTRGNLVYDQINKNLNVGVKTSFKPMVSATPSYNSPNSIIRKGLVLYLDGKISSYPQTGTTWYDLSGNGYNFTWQSTPTHVKQHGGYINKDGQEPGIVYPAPSDSNYAFLNNSGLALRDTFTEECWMRATNVSTYRTMISWGVHNSQQDRSLWLEQGTGRLALYFYATGDNMTVGSRNIADGSWHHCVGTWDGTYGKVYVDGHLEGSRFLTAGSYTYQGTWIGANPSTSYRFCGSIGYVAIYNRALSLNEIRYNYFANVKRFQSTKPML